MSTAPHSPIYPIAFSQTHKRQNQPTQKICYQQIQKTQETKERTRKKEKNPRTIEERQERKGNQKKEKR